jgi:hypothetical protein
LNGEIDTFISANLYTANGIFRNENDDVVATLSGNLLISDMSLTGNPIITYTNNKMLSNKYTSQISALSEQLSSITVYVVSSKLFDNHLISCYNNPWQLNSDETNVNIGYEALTNDINGLLSFSVD